MIKAKVFKRRDKENFQLPWQVEVPGLACFVRFSDWRRALEFADFWMHERAISEKAAS